MEELAAAPDPGPHTFDPPSRPRDRSFGVLAAILVLLTLGGLYAARTVFIPVVLAVLLHFILMPVQRALCRLRLPQSVAAAVVLLLLMGSVVLALYQLSGPAAEWLEELPQSVRGVEDKIRRWRQPVETVSRTAQRVGEFAQVPGASRGTVEVREFSLVDTLLSGGTAFLIMGAITVIMVYFLLAFRGPLLKRIVDLFPGPAAQARARASIRDMETNISRYLFTITAINVALGGVEALAMWLLGMPNPLLWGAMATTLNFIPYVGEVIGTGAVALAASLSFDSAGRVLLTTGVYYAITATEGNFITPLVLGKRFTLNPLVLFVWMIFWGWMWGVAGAILAVPMLAIFKLVLDNVPSAARARRLLEL